MAYCIRAETCRLKTVQDTKIIQLSLMDIIPIHFEKKLLPFLEALCFMHFIFRAYRSSMALLTQDHTVSEVQAL